MGGDDHVRQRHQQGQGLVLADGVGAVLVEPLALLFVDVEAGGADGPVPEGRQQRLAVHQPAAGRVDQREAGLGLRQRSGVDQVVGVRQERAVEGDDVGLGQQAVERHVFESRGRVGEGIVGQHAHAEALADAGEEAADLAGPDDAGRLAVEVEAGEAGEREVVVARAGRGTVDVPDQREQERGGVLGNGVGGIGGDAHDRQAGIPRRLEIDVVVAGAAHGQDPDPARDEPLDHRPVDLGVDERAGGIRPVRQGEGGGGEARLEVADVVAAGVGAVEGVPVVGFGVEKGERLHGGHPSGNRGGCKHRNRRPASMRGEGMETRSVGGTCLRTFSARTGIRRVRRGLFDQAAECRREKVRSALRCC